MHYEDAPQLPLTARKRALVATGAIMFAAQIVAAVLLAPPTTGIDDASPGVLLVLWVASLGWSVATVLLLVRQANRPDIATAAFIVAIAVCAAFVLTAAIDARGGRDEVDLVDALFFGVTIGALTALPVWAIAEAAARVLRLPASATPGQEAP